jgi:hypothetical protein
MPSAFSPLRDASLSVTTIACLFSLRCLPNGSPVASEISEELVSVSPYEGPRILL